MKTNNEKRGFEYLTILPTVYIGGEPHFITCGKRLPTAAKAAQVVADEEGDTPDVLYTLVGVSGANHSRIGLFDHFQQALDALRGITGVMRDAIDFPKSQGDEGLAASVLEDFINQCTNEERI